MPRWLIGRSSSCSCGELEALGWHRPLPGGRRTWMALRHSCPSDGLAGLPHGPVIGRAAMGRGFGA
eukprot:8745050-Alexandrium_andersonii.AAC.1